MLFFLSYRYRDLLFLCSKMKQKNLEEPLDPDIFSRTFGSAWRQDLALLQLSHLFLQLLNLSGSFVRDGIAPAVGD